MYQWTNNSAPVHSYEVCHAEIFMLPNTSYLASLAGELLRDKDVDTRLSLSVNSLGLILLIYS